MRYRRPQLREQNVEELEQDKEARQMLQRYLAEPTSIWLYTDIPVEERMAWAYLAADEYMGAPFGRDEVRRFVAALERVIVKPDSLWEQIQEKSDTRFQRLQELEWGLEVVPFEEMGVYPGFGGFPREWSFGNLLETAQAVSFGKGYEEKRYGILDLVNEWMTALKFLPPILVPGEYLRREQGDEFEETVWTIDDGNHRLVAAAIGGAQEAVCFIGT